ncbi:MAG: hypothetical protein D6706_19880, partial [Chloroflexi bacterium]
MFKLLVVLLIIIVGGTAVYVLRRAWNAANTLTHPPRRPLTTTLANTDITNWESVNFTTEDGLT